MAVASGTPRSSAVTLSCCAMGCGVLSLPRVFAMCGPVSSLAFLGLFASWVDASLRWLVVCGRYSGLDSFEGNVRFFVGPVAAKIVRLGQVLLTFGGIVAVLVTVASLTRCVATDLLAAVCEEGPGDLAADAPSWTAAPPSLQAIVADGLCLAHPLPCLPERQVLIFVTLAVFPLACQKSLHALRCFSVVSLGCLAYFVLALTWHLCRAFAGSFFFEGFGLLPGMRTNVPSTQVDEQGHADGSAFWQGPPILLMSLLCHGPILRLDRELRPDARPQVASIIRKVVLGTALPVYALVGAGGYWLYGNRVSSNVLEDFAGDPWMSMARVALSLTNLIKIPLAVVTLREDLASSAPQPWLRSALCSPTGRVGSSTAVLGAAALAAAWAGSLSRVLSLLGCLVGVPFSLCLPALLYWRLILRLEFRKAAKGLAAPLLKKSHQEMGPEGVTGSLALPSDAASRRRHQAHSAMVLTGGAAVGALGLASWFHSFDS